MSATMTDVRLAQTSIGTNSQPTTVGIGPRYEDTDQIRFDLRRESGDSVLFCNLTLDEAVAIRDALSEHLDDQLEPQPEPEAEPQVDPEAALAQYAALVSIRLAAYAAVTERARVFNDYVEICAQAGVDLSTASFDSGAGLALILGKAA